MKVRRFQAYVIEDGDDRVGVNEHPDGGWLITRPANTGRGEMTLSAEVAAEVGRILSRGLGDREGGEMLDVEAKAPPQQPTKPARPRSGKARIELQIARRAAVLGYLDSAKQSWVTIDQIVARAFIPAGLLESKSPRIAAGRIMSSLGGWDSYEVSVSATKKRVRVYARKGLHLLSRPSAAAVASVQRASAEIMRKEEA